MNLAYIALGSNLDNPLLQVSKAIEALASLGHINARSSWYRSQAIGPNDASGSTQPDYINGVLALATTLDAESLLAALQSIEHAHGRTRTVRWGARTLDLDILLFNNDIMTTEQLLIPHPRLAQRNFVVHPLHEIAPGLVLPDGRRIADLYASLSGEGLEKLPQNS